MSKLLKIGNAISPKFVWWAAHTFIQVKNRIELLSPNLSSQVYAGTCSIEEEIMANWKIFLTDEKMSDKNYLACLKKDMVDCYFLYGINANEYFVHHFEHKSRKMREEYLSKRDKNYACRLSEGGLESFNVLNDKYKFYTLVKEYFKRDVCKVETSTDKADFMNFASKHKRCIVKPISSSWGNGCQIIELNNSDDTFESLLKKDKYIVEELIEQDERMAIWNSSSVNTVRVCSFRQRWGGVIQIYPFMKTGRKGSVVDNAGQGGVYMSIDSATGEVCSKGMDELGNVYEEHPDSHMKFDNWTVPQWEELVKLSAEIHQVLPKEHIYVGFDFALDKHKGWVVIEGNWGDFICQQSSLGKGLKRQFYKAIRG